MAMTWWMIEPIFVSLPSRVAPVVNLEDVGFGKVGGMLSPGLQKVTSCQRPPDSSPALVPRFQLAIGDVIPTGERLWV